MKQGIIIDFKLILFPRLCGLVIFLSVIGCDSRERSNGAKSEAENARKPTTEQQLIQAAESNDSQDLVNLGNFYIEKAYAADTHPEKVEYSTLAIRCYNDSALLDNLEAIYLLGKHNFSIRLYELDTYAGITSEVEWYELASSSNYCPAMQALADMYLYGSGYEIEQPNIDKCLYWLEKAAQHEEGAGLLNLPSRQLYQLYLGTFSSDLMQHYYENREGMRAELKRYINYPKALHWAKVAHEHGDTAAALQIGTLYHGIFPSPEPDQYGVVRVSFDDENRIQAEGVPRNFEEAIRWYKIHADTHPNHFETASRIASIYCNGGYGVAKNYVEAERWYEAALEGLSWHYYMVMLGRLNETGGYGLDKNSKVACQWYERAALQGNVVAQERLAYLYYSGKGVIQNYEEAYAWALVAASNDDDTDVARVLGMEFSIDVKLKGQIRATELAKAISH
jgi:TPR repeat protein